MQLDPITNGFPSEHVSLGSETPNSSLVQTVICYCCLRLQKDSTFIFILTLYARVCVCAEATDRLGGAGLSPGFLHELVRIGFCFAGMSLLKCCEAVRLCAWRVRAFCPAYGAVRPALAFGSHKTEEMETSS